MIGDYYLVELIINNDCPSFVNNNCVKIRPNDMTILIIKYLGVVVFYIILTKWRPELSITSAQNHSFIPIARNKKLQESLALKQYGLVL